MRHFVQASILTLLLLIAFVGQSLAQNLVEEDVSKAFELRAASLVTAFEAAGDDDAKLANLRGDADLLRDEASAAAADLQVQTTAATSALEQLGEAPKDGTVVDPKLAKQRDDLNKQLQTLQAELVSLNATSSSAKQVLSRIAALRRNAFTNRVLERTPLSTEALSQGASAYSSNFTQVRLLLKNWVVLNATNRTFAFFGAIFAGLLASFGLYLVFRKTIGRYLVRNIREDSPQLFTKLNIAFWKALMPPVVTGFCLFVIYFIFNNLQMMGPKLSHLLWLTITIVIALVFVWNLTTAILAPSRPNWRLVGLTNAGAARLRRLTFLSAVSYGVIYFGTQLANILDAPVEFTLVTGLIAALVQGSILFLMSRMSPLPAGPDASTHRERMEEYQSKPVGQGVLAGASEQYGAHGALDDEPSKPWPAILRLPMVLSGTVIILAALFGYVGMASFLSRQLVVTGAILVTMYLAYIASRELGREGIFANTQAGAFAAKSAGLSDRGVEQLGIFAGLLSFLAIMIIGLPLIALQWGAQVADILLFFRKIFTGIQIGGISVSLSGIVFGLFVFFLGYFLTRIFQRWLDNGVMSRSRVDTGVRDSIRKGVGYAGIALASIIAVTAAGINLSSLAIVAGALSLGIGFGLQNIVSNFVSGLILLVERPSKVGDISSVRGYDVTVSEICVRATQRATFEKRTVTIPNSDLINGTVKNWTHGSRISRYDIPVGVSYGTNTRLVEDLLLEIASAHEKVISEPGPWVMFADFGASSLDFTLYIYVADLSDGVAVRNEIRHQIVEALEENDISMPFPQRDVNLTLTPTEVDDVTKSLPSAQKATPISEEKPARKSKPRRKKGEAEDIQEQ